MEEEKKKFKDYFEGIMKALEKEIVKQGAKVANSEVALNCLHLCAFAVGEALNDAKFKRSAHEPIGFNSECSYNENLKNTRREVIIMLDEVKEMGGDSGFCTHAYINLMMSMTAAQVAL
jgi:hypothetical protein